jgi:hypothetical protein
MRSLGIALIFIGALGLLVVLASVPVGKLGLVSVESWVYLASPILIVVGILLAALGAKRVDS